MYTTSVLSLRTVYIPIVYPLRSRYEVVEHICGVDRLDCLFYVCISDCESVRVLGSCLALGAGLGLTTYRASEVLRGAYKTSPSLCQANKSPNTTYIVELSAHSLHSLEHYKKLAKKKKEFVLASAVTQKNGGLVGNV